MQEMDALAAGRGFKRTVEVENVCAGGNRLGGVVGGKPAGENRLVRALAERGIAVAMRRIEQHSIAWRAAGKGPDFAA